MFDRIMLNLGKNIIQKYIDENNIVTETKEKTEKRVIDKTSRRYQMLVNLFGSNEEMIERLYFNGGAE